MTDKSAVLVPREPTEAMLRAGGREKGFWHPEEPNANAASRIYAAMIAAAPVSPPSVVDDDVLRSFIYTATHEVLPLADGVTGTKQRAGMQVKIADRVIALIASSLTGGG